MTTYEIIAATCHQCDCLMVPITKLRCPICQKENKVAQYVRAHDTALVTYRRKSIVRLRQQLREAEQQRDEALAALRGAAEKAYMDGAEAALRHLQMPK